MAKVVFLVLRRSHPLEKEGVMSGRSGAHKPDKLGLSYKAYKYSDAGTGDLVVSPTHEGSVCPGLDELASSAREWPCRALDNRGQSEVCLIVDVPRLNNAYLFPLL